MEFNKTYTEDTYNLGMTTLSDFCCEQPGLYNQSYSCRWCQQIFQCIDVHTPTEAHNFCHIKKRELTTDDDIEWSDTDLRLYAEIHPDE